ncbi:universal stress protein [Streptomyces venezuelae]|uniref:universal stress protein n=1 Tax=Streptomyces venezuelae TaxID=54571 RepID=UPI00278C6381|nr:universal stress protein [Streptomyces venezuelae]
MDATTGRSGLGRIVVGVDGSPFAQTAVTWAAQEAARRGTSLCLVHATDTDALPELAFRTEIEQSRRSGRALLDRTAHDVAAHHPDVVVLKELSGGSPSRGLRSAAALSGTIVVGHRGLGGFSALLLGSVGLKLAAEATTPLVVVRGVDEPAEAGSVVAAVRDGNDLGVARAAAREARLRKVSLKLLHVWRTAPYTVVRTTRRNGNGEGAGEHVRALADVAEHVHEEFPELALEAVGEKSQSVPGALVEATRHADLLIVGGRRSPGYLGPTLGRTTLGLLQHAHCPVELIPRSGPGHGSTS